MLADKGQYTASVSTQLRDERQRSSDLGGVVSDMEISLRQFRDLVTSLQRYDLGVYRTASIDRYISETDHLRMQQATQEVESASTTKEAQALMNQNLKLQSSAARTHSKTVELELKRIQAAQLAEQMQIITVSIALLPPRIHLTK